MNEWLLLVNDFLESTRRSYDNIAREYAEHIYGELAGKPFDRALLDRFGEMVKPLGVAVDMGCGPGQIACYLRERGVNVIGVDLSPEMVATARALNPDIEFQIGNMLALEHVPDATWGGIAAFYSIIHLPRTLIEDALSEFHRVLVPHGIVLLAFHRGDETHVERELWGKPIYLEFSFLTAAEVADALRRADFEILDLIERTPYAADVEYPSHRVYILARKLQVEP